MKPKNKKMYSVNVEMGEEEEEEKIETKSKIC